MSIFNPKGDGVREREGQKAENETALKPYDKPMLEELGDLRTLTLGVSPGGGDSLNPFIYKA